MMNEYELAGSVDQIVKLYPNAHWYMGHPNHWSQRDADLANKELERRGSSTRVMIGQAMDERPAG